MVDWERKRDGFLEFNEKNILTAAGKISHQMTLNHAEKEFLKNAKQRRIKESKEPTSDFDMLVVAKVKELGPAVKAENNTAKTKKKKK